MTMSMRFSSGNCLTTWLAITSFPNSNQPTHDAGAIHDTSGPPTARGSIPETKKKADPNRRPQNPPPKCT